MEEVQRVSEESLISGTFLDQTLPSPTAQRRTLGPPAGHGLELSLQVKSGSSSFCISEIYLARLAIIAHIG